MSFASKLLDLIFPPKCAFCRCLLPDSSAGLCAACEKDLPRAAGSDIKQKIPFVSFVAAPLYYEGKVRQSLLRFKFGGCPGYADVYARILADFLGTVPELDFDTVTWVPLSAKRLRGRGYDQARLIAEKTAALLAVPCVPTLKKVRNVGAQSAMGSAEKRRANIGGAYAVPDGTAVAGKKLLLADDIVTTGATLSECARMLGMAGAARVTAAAVARRRD